MFLLKNAIEKMKFGYFNKIFIALVIVCISPVLLNSQVKVGDSPSLIDPNSILELESDNKVMVLTRLSQDQINAIEPLEGALVYNTDTQCIYVFKGSFWKNLCNEPNISVSNTSPTANDIGDFWFNNANNEVSVWDGNQWLPITVNPRRGVGVPTSSYHNLLAGDIYVDQTTGDIYTYNGSNWVPLNQSIATDNGLTLSGSSIQLGGLLTTPTVITTNTVNTLAIRGLGTTLLANTNNSAVVVDNSTGELKKVASTNLVIQEQVVFNAANGQTQFTAPLNITDLDKIDVYRNGARVSFSLINATTIELEAEAACFEGDEIRIVQIN